MYKIERDKQLKEMISSVLSSKATQNKLGEILLLVANGADEQRRTDKATLQEAVDALDQAQLAIQRVKAAIG